MQSIKLFDLFQFKYLNILPRHIRAIIGEYCKSWKNIKLVKKFEFNYNIKGMIILKKYIILYTWKNIYIYDETFKLFKKIKNVNIHNIKSSEKYIIISLNDIFSIYNEKFELIKQENFQNLVIYNIYKNYITIHCEKYIYIYDLNQFKIVKNIHENFMNCNSINYTNKYIIININDDRSSYIDYYDLKTLDLVKSYKHISKIKDIIIYDNYIISNNKTEIFIHNIDNFTLIHTIQCDIDIEYCNIYDSILTISDDLFRFINYDINTFKKNNIIRLDKNGAGYIINSYLVHHGFNDLKLYDVKTFEIICHIKNIYYAGMNMTNKYLILRNGWEVMIYAKK